MYLEDSFRNGRTHSRYHSQLIRTCGDHHVSSFDRAVVCRKQIAAGTLCSLQRGDFHSATRRSFDKGRVVFDEAHDLPTRRESLWIVALVFVAGQFDRPVGKLEAETTSDTVRPKRPTCIVTHLPARSVNRIRGRGDPGVVDRPGLQIARLVRTLEADLVPDQHRRTTEARQIGQRDLGALLDPARPAAADTGSFDPTTLDMDLQRSAVGVIDDTENVDVGQPDEQLAHASSVRFHEGSQSEGVENHQIREPSLRVQGPHPPLIREEPDTAL